VHQHAAHQIHFLIEWLLRRASPRTPLTLYPIHLRVLLLVDRHWSLGELVLRLPIRGIDGELEGLAEVGLHPGVDRHQPEAAAFLVGPLSAPKSSKSPRQMA